MIRQQVSSLITTVRDDSFLVEETNKSVYVSAVPYSKQVQSSAPTTAAGKMIFAPPNSSLLKFMPVCTTATVPTIRVFGWSKTRDTTSLWVPSLLYSAAVTFGGSLVTVGGGSVYCPISFSLNYGAAVTYAGSSSYHPGHAVIDMLGSQLIEIEVSINSAANFNALVGGI
jgi:hypothetical protein